jgi:putative transposase
MKEDIGTHRLRKGRFSEIGRYYFLTTSTRDRIPIFTLPEAAKIVLSSLFWIDGQGQINLEAAVIMPDHVHFIAQLCSGSLTTLMRTLKGYTARKINQLLNRKGPLWQPQYHDHAIRKDEVLEEITLYCLNNPVRSDWSEISMTIPTGSAGGKSEG